MSRITEQRISEPLPFDDKHLDRRIDQADLDAMSLRQLAEKTGTDKAPNCHVYEKYLRHLRDQPFTLLEIGIGGGDDPNAGGASLRMWKNYSVTQ